jgi:hypothetical protein
VKLIPPPAPVPENTQLIGPALAGSTATHITKIARRKLFIRNNSILLMHPSLAAFS